MCDGFSEAVMVGGIAAAAGGTALAVAQTAQQANAEQQMAQYQAQTQQTDQAIAEQNAQTAMDQSAYQVQQQQLKTAAELGAQRAQMGADGVALDSGSALDVQSDTAMLGELSALDVRSQGQAQAYQDMAQATTDGNQAGLYDLRAEDALASGELSSARTLLGGSGSLASSYPY